MRVLLRYLFEVDRSECKESMKSLVQETGFKSVRVVRACTAHE